MNVVASIQYRALANKGSDAFYRLSNTRTQIQAYVFDGMCIFFFFEGSLTQIYKLLVIKNKQGISLFELFY